MMPKRDNAYFRRRLEVEHPRIWKDLNDGKYSSEREAFIAAGLRSERTRLNELKNAWTKATYDEKREFIGWLKAQPGVTSAPGPAVSSLPTLTAPMPTLATTRRKKSPRPATSIFDSDNRLLPAAIMRIEHLLSLKRMRRGDLLHELGFKKLNPSLGFALRNLNRINDDDLAHALEQWVHDNRHL